MRWGFDGRSQLVKHLTSHQSLIRYISAAGERFLAFFLRRFMEDNVLLCRRTSLWMH